MSSFPEHLKDRYLRFRFRHFDINRDHYEELAAHGQNPDVMIVSCCDSRCDPETIFSAMPGELFVVRNVANLIPPYETGGIFHGVSAALEFAVLNLRVKHIVVMGHAGCGGIKAALDGGAAHQTEARFISKWMSMLDDARMKLLSSHQGSDRGQLVAAMEREAINVSLANLRSFPFVSEQEKKGRLTLYGSHFDIASGQLSVLNQGTGEYNPL
jgi:carbonic anhydrase